jgi:prolipoprotein diacylglyceryl transferase
MRSVLPLASIPSPHTGVIHVGPLVVHMYGLTLLLAIVACIALTGIRWTRRGGDWDLVLRVAVWGVAFGVIGARAYHDITSWDEVPSPKWKGVFEVWQGGLGVWGGILLGCLAGAVVVWRSGSRVRDMMDAVAPGLLLAQGIGRWGNWWNQELYGKPTSLPWGLKIDAQHAPNGVAGTYHPTFLYEFVYDCLAVGLLLVLDRRYRFKPPALFALYVSLYTAFRSYEETLRIDPSHHLGGMRINFYVSVVVFAISTAFFVWWQFLRRDEEQERPKGPARTRDTGPTMAIPKSRVRPSR